jgi:hypothetical protein
MFGTGHPQNGLLIEPAKLWILESTLPSWNSPMLSGYNQSLHVLDTGKRADTPFSGRPSSVAITHVGRVSPHVPQPIVLRLFHYLSTLKLAPVRVD